MYTFDCAAAQWRLVEPSCEPTICAEVCLLPPRDLEGKGYEYCVFFFFLSILISCNVVVILDTNQTNYVAKDTNTL